MNSMAQSHFRADIFFAGQETVRFTEGESVPRNRPHSAPTNSTHPHTHTHTATYTV